MSARPSRRRVRGSDSVQTTPRHLWLATLGAVSIARREALTAVGIAFEELSRFRNNAGQFAADARDVAKGAAMTVQEALSARIEPQVGRFSTEVEARLAPVLQKLGVDGNPQVRRRTVKPAKRRAKAARTAAGRSRAANRVARKGRA